MSSNELVEQIMAQVIARVATPEQQALPDTPHPTGETAMAEKSCSLTEFVGTAIGDTLGLVIANVDAALLEAMKLEKRYRSIGILGARTAPGRTLWPPMKRSKPPTPKWSALSFLATPKAAQAMAH